MKRLQLNEVLEFDNVDDGWKAAHGWTTRHNANLLHERLSAHYAPWLSGKEILWNKDYQPREHQHVASAIAFYKSDSQHINKTLIKDHHTGESSLTDFMSNKLNWLDAHLSAFKAPENLVVYSGISRNWAKEQVSTLRKGETLYSPALISASVKPSMAIGFGGSHLIFGYPESKKDGIHVLQMHVPKDSNMGAYIGHVGGAQEEQEFLLRRDQHYRYHGVVKTMADPEDPDVNIHIHKLTPA